MIITFKDRGTEDIFNGVQSRAARKACPTTLVRSARGKLFVLDDAATIEDLRAPPGNMLEAMKGDRRGQHSIRINRQYRICFEWTAAGPRDVEIVDYHA